MLEETCQKILDYAKISGADQADVMAVHGTSISIEVRKQALEQIERSDGIEFGLRVFKGKRQAIVSGSDLSEASIKLMTERAVDMAKAAPEDPYCGLAKKSELVAAWNVDELELSDDQAEPQPEELENQAMGTSGSFETEEDFS